MATRQASDIKLHKTEDPDVLSVCRRRQPEMTPVAIGQVVKDPGCGYLALGAMGDRIPGLWPTRRAAVAAVRRLDIRLAGL